MRQFKKKERSERSHAFLELTSRPDEARSEQQKHRQEKGREGYEKRQRGIQGIGAGDRKGSSRGGKYKRAGGRENDRMENAVKYNFIASPHGGHIQICVSVLSGCRIT